MSVFWKFCFMGMKLLRMLGWKNKRIFHRIVVLRSTAQIVPHHIWRFLKWTFSGNCNKIWQLHYVTYMDVENIWILLNNISFSIYSIYPFHRYIIINCTRWIFRPLVLGSLQLMDKAQKKMPMQLISLLIMNWELVYVNGINRVNWLFEIWNFVKFCSIMSQNIVVHSGGGQRYICQVQVNLPNTNVNNVS